MADQTHDKPGHGCADYYCAARDNQGGIRLNGGRGLLVANADHTIDDVRGWFDRSRPGAYREQYRTALRLMLREQGHPDERPVHSDEQPGHVAPTCAHRKVTLHADGGWICVDEPACHQRFILSATEAGARTCRVCGASACGGACERTETQSVADAPMEPRS